MNITTKSFSLLFIAVSAISATTVSAEDSYQKEITSTDEVLDSDGDTFPDLTEEIGGTNPYDISDFPGSEVSDLTREQSASKTAVQLTSAGFPTSSCRSGFRQAGPRLCISSTTQNATRYDTASYRCRLQKARVATYEDLFYLYIATGLDATYDPNGKWIGNMVGDDSVLFGNKTISTNNDPDIWNFDGATKVTGSRYYWCAHDDES